MAALASAMGRDLARGVVRPHWSTRPVEDLIAALTATMAKLVQSVTARRDLAVWQDAGAVASAAGMLAHKICSDAPGYRTSAQAMRFRRLGEMAPNEALACLLAELEHAAEQYQGSGDHGHSEQILHDLLCATGFVA